MMTTKFQPQLVTVGESWFTIELTPSKADLLESRGLLDGDMAHLLNGLADLLAQQAHLSPFEIDVFKECLFRFTADNFNINLYAHVRNQAGPEGINRNLWLKFAEELKWPSCTLLFMDMPTNVLEEIAQDIWDIYLTYYGSRYRTSDMKDEIIYSLGHRTDIYGSESMPPELAFGILIEEKRR